MAYPVPSTTRRRPDLEETFRQYDLEMNLAKFIALQVMPVKEVPVKTGTFGKITAAQLMRLADTARDSANTAGEELRRAPTGEYVRDELEFEDDFWNTQEYGKEERVDHNEAAQYASYFEHEMVMAQRARFSVMLAHERRTAAALTDATGVTLASLKGINATENWSLAANWGTSGLIQDVESAAQNHFDLVGVYPDAMIMNEKVFRNLRQNADVISRVTSSGAGDKATAQRVNVQQMAEVFDIDNILVGRGVYDTTGASQATSAFTPGFIWPDRWIILTKISRGVDLGSMMGVGYGRTMHWGMDGSLPLGAMESYMEDRTRSTYIRSRHQVQSKVLYSEMRVLIDLTQALV